ncbi:MAG: hypothetical protein P8J68_01225 [Arenicellaceae bacterium]|nr:hypothetical protein [Arenicellaceae bacterium]
MPVHIIAMFTAVLVLLQIYCSFKVVRRRRAQQSSLGGTGDKKL